jgi:hypothetical protein
VFPHDGLRVGLVESSVQLKNMVEPPIPRPLIGVMLFKVVSTD